MASQAPEAMPPVTEPTIRRRFPTGMRPLDIEADGAELFAAAEAKHDKIVLTLHVSVPITRAQAQEYVESITNVDPSGLHRIILATRLLDGSIKIQTTKHWHFTLAGHLRPVPGGLAYAGHLVLTLNPTRFLAHQSSVHSDDLMHLSPAITLRRNQSRSRQLTGVVLNKNDNVLISPEGHDVASFLGGTTLGHRRQWWARILNLYLAQVLVLLRGAFSPQFMPDATSPSGSGIVASVNYGAIRQCEVYWEFSTEQALTFVRNFTEVVKQRDPGAQEFWSPAQSGARANEMWVSIAPQSGIRITTYAKLVDRVRVEVKYLSDISSAINRLGMNAGTPLVDRLLGLMDDASERASLFWNGARSGMQQSDEHCDVVRFLSVFNRVCPEENRAALISILAARGCITHTSAGGVAPSKVIRALVDAGLLDRLAMRRRSSSAHVAAQYSRLFGRLFGPA